METSSAFMMIATDVVVTVVTGYFFWLVLKSPPKPEPDSYQDNDDQPRPTDA